MIDLEKSYIAAAEKGPVYFYLDFACETCGHRYNSFSLNLSAFLYGVALLAGKNINYVGFTCLSCLRTNLLKSYNLDSLKQDLDFFMQTNGSHLNLDLRYHSPVPLPPEQIPELKDVNIISWEYPLSDGGHMHFHDHLNSYLTENPCLETDYICTHLNDGELPIGTMATILWFKPEQIEGLVEIENDHHISVFPRYIHKMSWYERYDSFCWRHKLYQDYLAGVKISASETFIQLREYARQNDKNLDNLIDANPGIFNTKAVEHTENQAHQNAANDVTAAAEFLDLLMNYNPEPWDLPCNMSGLFKNMWKSVKPFRNSTDQVTPEGFDPSEFDPKITDILVNEMVNCIRPHLSKGFVQQWANDNYLNFIKDYISLAQRSDFSYGYVWDLKWRYIEALSKILMEPIPTETKNAFYVGPDTSTIIFKGTPIPGLIGKGYKYIQYLIIHESKHIDVSELKKLFPEDNETDLAKESDAAEIADKRTRKELRDELILLNAKREKAEKSRDTDKLEKIEARLEEIENFWNEISRTKVKSKIQKPKKFSSNEYKKRDSVKQAILRAILKLKKSDHKTWEHFDKALKPVGLDYVRYLPDEDIDWEIK